MRTFSGIPHTVVHFAIHADAVDRARRFYSTVFGWRFEAWGPPGFFRVFTGIEGALHERPEPLSGAGVRAFECTISIDDLPAIRAAVVASGGTIVYDEVEIPTVGRLVQFLDTEQNIVSAMHYEPGVLR